MGEEWVSVLGCEEVSGMWKSMEEMWKSVWGECEGCGEVGENVLGCGEVWRRVSESNKFEAY